MKLETIIPELKRQSESKRDFIANSTNISMATNGLTTLRLHDNEAEPEQYDPGKQFQIKDQCHSQIAERMGIPVQYYNRMLAEAPELLGRNVNHWLRATPKNILLRTLDGHARAFLSNRYRPIDHYDLLPHILDEMERAAQANLDIQRAHLDDQRFYLQAINRGMTTTLKGRNDIVMAGIMFRNSETGHGAVTVVPRLFQLICRNGMVADVGHLRQVHLGRSRDEEFLYSESTKSKENEVIVSKVRDLVKVALQRDVFEKVVDVIRRGIDAPIEKPTELLEGIGHRFGMSDFTRNAILDRFCTKGDPTQYGLVNAITATARSNYDIEDNFTRCVELEKIGGRIASTDIRNLNRIADGESEDHRKDLATRLLKAVN